MKFNSFLKSPKHRPATSTIHTLELLTWLPALLNPFPALERLVKKHGDFIVFRIANGQVHVLLNHPEHAKHVLKTNASVYERGKAIFPIKDFLGNGIFMSESPSWDVQHALLKPAFHEKQIQQYTSVVKEELQQLDLLWHKAAVDKSPVDLSIDLKRLMLRILVRTQIAEGLQLDYDRLISLLDRVLLEASFQKFIQSEITLAVFKKLGISRPKRISKNIKAVEEIVADILLQIERNQLNLGYTTSMLLEERSQGVLQQKDLRDMFMNLFFAGYDTSATALAFTLHSLARHPEIQKKAYQETTEFLKTGAPILSVYREMKYSKMVIQESLRLYPPAWGFHRFIATDDEINGRPIKAKTYINILPYLLHRHPDFWERPNEFYPEHFSNETLKDKTFVFMPFGQGQRMCVGKPMAMMELQLLLPELLHRFEFTALSKKAPKLRPGIIIQAKRPLMVRLTPRKNES